MISSVSLFLLIILLLLLLVAVIVILWQMLKSFQKTQERQSRLTKEILTEQSKSQKEIQESQERIAIAQTEVVSKAMSLLASSDALTYQAIQAMENPPEDSIETSQSNVIDDVPPSDEEWDRLYAKHLGGEAMSDEESERFNRGFSSTY